jgi:hypothetical protein
MIAADVSPCDLGWRRCPSAFATLPRSNRSWISFWLDVAQIATDEHHWHFVRGGGSRKVPAVYLAVRLKPGGPWDWSRDLREPEQTSSSRQFRSSTYGSPTSGVFDF